MVLNPAVKRDSWKTLNSTAHPHLKHNPGAIIPFPDETFGLTLISLIYFDAEL
jgi:hypothetical protein